MGVPEPPCSLVYALVGQDGDLEVHELILALREGDGDVIGQVQLDHVCAWSEKFVSKAPSPLRLHEAAAPQGPSEELTGTSPFWMRSSPADSLFGLTPFASAMASSFFCLSCSSSRGIGEERESAWHPAAAAAPFSCSPAFAGTRQVGSDTHPD
jgi:hypothetical protein